jgi:hypothetical protein
MTKVKALEEAELIENRRKWAAERKEAQEEYPFIAWEAFLRFKAAKGDRPP